MGGKDQKFKGAEALVRWNHPTYGLLTPDVFIQLFEIHHLIGRLDLYVFEEVCQIIKCWESLNQLKVPISVNLSRVAIKSNDFNALNQIFELKQKYDIPDFSIEVETTESIMFEKTDLPLAKQFIQLMHMHGISISLDDFGKGYSTLSILKEIDVDAIKLDRSFFINANENT